MLRLFGLLLPYNVRSSSPVGLGVGEAVILRERIDPRAFQQDALSANHLAEFRVNHERPSVADAQVHFVNMHSGLYVSAALPDSAATREISRRRSEWRGMSISYDLSEASRSIDWSTETISVSRIGFVSHVAIVIDRQPAYSTTWVEEFGDRALARMKSENRAVLQARWSGLDLDSLPPSYTAVPIQSVQQEQRLTALDPMRPWSLGGLDY